MGGIGEAGGSMMALPTDAAIEVRGRLATPILAPAAVFDVRPVALDDAASPSAWQAAAKRGVDIVGALFLIVLVLPVLVTIAVIIRLSSGSPVFFRQTRVGRHGLPFTMLKFRSFPVEHVPASVVIEDGDIAVVPDSRSPIWFGRVLRQTSLDELPQLFNVLLGHMSLVGPRPERPELVAALATRIPAYADRHRVPVGLTGLAQVNGLCGMTSVEDRVATDNRYIDTWSLRTDLSILVRTVPTLIRKARVRY